MKERQKKHTPIHMQHPIIPPNFDTDVRISRDVVKMPEVVTRP
jgi:hypothetical protein